MLALVVLTVIIVALGVKRVPQGTEFNDREMYGAHSPTTLFSGHRNTAPLHENYTSASKDCLDIGLSSPAFGTIFKTVSW